jgi:hypothetical protein
LIAAPGASARLNKNESEILVQRDDAALLITTIDNVIVVQVDTNTILITN